VSRPAIIVSALLVAAATVFATGMLVISSNRSALPQMTEDQQLTRQKIFSSGDELPPIEKGQEMRPRW